MAAITPEIREVVARYLTLVQQERRVFRAYLYGSHAKGTSNQWSDIDVAIISPDFSEDLFSERVFLMKLALRVDDRLEPDPFRPEDFTRNNPLVNEINMSGIEMTSN